MPKYVNLITFLLRLISKEHVVVITEFSDWVKIYIYYISTLIILLRPWKRDYS